MHQYLYIFIACIIVYGLTNYGGIRAPDSEVVFRVSESIADSASFSPKDLEAWPGFGVSTGKDGRIYSVYPPLESITLIPALYTARLINRTEWYENVNPPVSHFVDRSLYSVLFGKPLSNPEKHALRYIVSLFDILISAMTVAVLYAILILISGSRIASLVLTAAYAFGTLVWSYAGSFFSEPLSTLLILYSFYMLANNDPVFHPKPASGLNSFLISGVSLGLAVAGHYTALLFMPFWVMYIHWMNRKILSLSGKKNQSGMGMWMIGFGGIMLVLGYYNYIRFGDFFQSGREWSAFNKAEFVSLFSNQFWTNLYGLTIGTGKGLVWFAPASVIAIAAWRQFRTKHIFLFFLLISAGIVRIIFTAHYKDWHGGYCLGPRYLYMMIPFMIIPAVFWFREIFEKFQWNKMIAAGIILYLCVIQQLYFALGEIFSYYHGLNFQNQSKGIDIFLNDRIYLSWNMSPLTNLHLNYRGPWLIQSLEISNIGLWYVMSCIVLIFFIGASIWIKQNVQNTQTPHLRGRT